MEEKIIIKSERFNVKLVSDVITIIGFLLPIAYTIFDVIRYTPDYQYLASRHSDWFDYSSPLDMALQCDGGFIVVAIVSIIFIIIAKIVYELFSKIELTVTDKRVYGIVKFSKRVDLPLDSISAVGTSAMKGIAVTTASGAIKFKFIKNRDEIHEKISKLLVERQDNHTKNKPEIPQSTADELKKFKDLLDSGVITQAEFDEKKKLLLGL